MQNTQKCVNRKQISIHKSLKAKMPLTNSNTQQQKLALLMKEPPALQIFTQNRKNQKEERKNPDVILKAYSRHEISI